MRITKQIATDVAKNLCLAKRVELSQLKAAQKEFIRSIYLKQLPIEIQSMFTKMPSYFRTTTSLYINGPGLPQGYKTYSIGQPLPSINGDRITVTESFSTGIQKNEDAIEAKNKQVLDLEESIEIALFNLRTYSNVEKEFPEAFKLLPVASVNTALVINIKDIRCKLDKANC